MTKFLKYLLYALLAVSAIVVIAFYVQLGGLSTEQVTDGECTMIPVMLNWAYVLFGICLVCALVLPMVFSSGKGVKGLLIKLAVAVVLCGISYALASGDPVQANVTPEPSAATLKMTDAGLILTCILFAAALLSIVSGGVMGLIRNHR